MHPSRVLHTPTFTFYLAKNQGMVKLPNHNKAGYPCQQG